MNEHQIFRAAEMAHTVNRAYCLSIGDTSQPEWKDAPEWQRASAVNGVKFHIDNPETGPSGSHENWMREKIEQGWIYGPEKNPEKKEHHCLVPYEQLSAAQQSKDYIFHAIVHQMMTWAKIDEEVTEMLSRQYDLDN